MGWSEVIGDIEEKVAGTVKGTFRPLDGIPFFTVCYPPEEERNAIREFNDLSGRFVAKGMPSEVVSLENVLKAALIELDVVNANDERAIVEFERSKKREELKEDLSRYLPEQISDLILL